MSYRQPLTYKELLKVAAAILTPEAEQAAVQPPMDPAMAGGAAPMPPQGAPMDPAMDGAPAGAPPTPGAPMEATGPRGGAIPPEILQDQMFMQFLMEALGVTYDPNSGMFMDPNGQPVPVEMIIQAYQEFQMEMQQQQAGAQPPAGAPMDPSMLGGAPVDPAAVQGGMPPEEAPIPPDGGAMPPDAGMPPMETGAPAGEPQETPMEQVDPVNEIASAVMSGVEAILQDFTATMEKKLSALLDRVEGLNKAVDALQSTTDRRAQRDKDADAELRDEIAADLMPTTKAASTHKASTINLFDAITGNKR